MVAKKKKASTKQKKTAAKKASPKKKVLKKERRHSNRIQAIIFDMDNVLVDTRHSYLDAIRWTVDIYLTHGKIPFFTLANKTSEPAILSPEDVHEFKMLGGFNDDWDCCYGLLVYLLNLEVKPHTIAQLKKQMNIAGFVESVYRKPLQVNGITKKLGRPGGVTVEKISRIFQEVYLGTKLFQQIERIPPFFWKKKGLIHKERPIFKKPILEKLNSLDVRLGIATGRPRFEALYALNEFDLLDYFDSMTTINEVKKAEKEEKKSLRKPHPYSLLQTAEKMGVTEGVLYVGDLPDDMLATEKAKSSIDIRSVAFPSYAHDPEKAKEEMRRVKPDFMIEKASDLPKLVKNPAKFALN